MTDAAGKSFVDLTANIVSAYLSYNPTPASEIPNLISQIHAALLRVSSGRSEAPPEQAKPAVSVKKSIQPDYLVCLEDGKRFKSLRRHLRTQLVDRCRVLGDLGPQALNFGLQRRQLRAQLIDRRGVLGDLGPQALGFGLQRR